MTARAQLLLVAVGVLLLLGCSPSADSSSATEGEKLTPCRQTRLDRSYVDRVTGALRTTEDVWGNELLAAPGGPTYAGARAYLAPLQFARGPKGTKLTASGYHYVPFSGPVDTGGAGTMALHVADGSQILAQRASGRALTLAVGPTGNERFGSCLSRLGPSRLASGFLPILETTYVDAQGNRYRQESFATRAAKDQPLVSLVALTAESAGKSAAIRFTPSDKGLERRGSSLVRRDGSPVVGFSEGAAVEGSSVRYEVPADRSRTVYVAWFNSTASGDALDVGRESYETSRAELVRYWKDRLAAGPRIEVPEPLVENAYRAVLLQNLALTWRYSVGNPYQQFSYPEGVDVAQVMAAQGFGSVSRSILLTSLQTPLTRYPNWKMGQKLVGSALYYRLYRDRAYVERSTPYLRTYVLRLGRQIESSPRGILDRERFSSDIADSVYGLHTHAVVWQGLRSMGSVWADTGHRPLGQKALGLAARLEKGLRAAVQASKRRLPDGSLFVPARLLDDEQPYRSVTESRAGAYWNLVAPYAFASGLFTPGSSDANGIIRYLLLHGSRLLGLVRAGVYSMYGLDASYPTSGVNPVYGLNAARLFADNDRADQLVLSLYGQLAVAMAPGTFVAGEGVSVAPLGHEYLRSTYLPPNGASNGSFLETLRLMLVRETRGPTLEPRGLELASATPRSWLEPGRRIVAQGLPTSFGPVSFSIVAAARDVHVTVDVPHRARARSLHLHLRLPAGRRISGVTLAGSPYTRYDAQKELVDLSGRTGRIRLRVRIGRA